MVSPAVMMDDVSVQLGGSEILDRLSLEVEEGAWLAVIGPNGAGKTTALRCIADAVPFTGSVTLAGRRVTDMSSREVALSVAMVPQHPVLPEGMRVVDYVLLGRTPHRGAMTSESGHDLEVVAGILEALDLGRFSDREVASLSGGELQRVVIGRALAQETQVLLLDEPTTALDVGRQQEVLELIDELRRDHGLTVLSAMHDLTVAGQFADRLVMVAAGRVVAEGMAKDVLTADRIREHYGASVRIEAGGIGGVVVIPVRRSATDEGVGEPADDEAGGAAEEPDEEVLDP
jgi:iron complex transport system ATP-binding protein